MFFPKRCNALIKGFERYLSSNHLLVPCSLLPWRSYSSTLKPAQNLRDSQSGGSSMAQRRLAQIVKELAPPPPSVGTLKLGDISYEVPTSFTPSRLVRNPFLLDIQDPVNLDNLHFLLQKFLLGQDVFLVSQPGPYARRLALTFAR